MASLGLSTSTKSLVRTTLTIKVTNIGRSPVTIDKAGWMVTPPNNPNEIHYGGGTMPKDLPARLEANDTREWDSPIRTNGPDYDGSVAYPFASFVKRASWIERRRGVDDVRKTKGMAQRLEPLNVEVLRELSLGGQRPSI